MSDRPLQRLFPALHPGDPVTVIAPSGPFDRAAFEAGLAVLAGRYRIRYDEGMAARHRYLAGSDARRLAELKAALADEDSRAVFCARGGYGMLRLLAGLEGCPMTPKAVVGFSDITALHAWLARARRTSIHGPVVTQLGRLDAADAARLFALLESTAPPEPLAGTDTFAGGTAEGPLLGGNLAVFTRLLGTDYLPALAGAILLLEDVGERPYQLDRMWTHLALAGVFGVIRGIVLGTFTGCEERDASYSSAEVLRELAAGTGLPCAAGFPIGHGEHNAAVPLGARVRLDADARTLTFLESPAR